MSRHSICVLRQSFVMARSFYVATKFGLGQGLMLRQSVFMP